MSSGSMLPLWRLVSCQHIHKALFLRSAEHCWRVGLADVRVQHVGVELCQHIPAHASGSIDLHFSMSRQIAFITILCLSMHERATPQDEIVNA